MRNDVGCRFDGSFLMDPYLVYLRGFSPSDVGRIAISNHKCLVGSYAIEFECQAKYVRLGFVDADFLADECMRKTRG